MLMLELHFRWWFIHIDQWRVTTNNHCKINLFIIPNVGHWKVFVGFHWWYLMVIGCQLHVFCMFLTSFAFTQYKPQILKREVSEKNEWLGRVKEFLPEIFAWGAYYFPWQKRLFKVKQGFEGSVFNVILSLF